MKSEPKMKGSLKEPRPQSGKSHKGEKAISKAYPVVDNDLARDNMENDIPAADLEDL